MISARPVTRDDELLFNEWLDQDELHKSLGITFEDLFVSGTFSQVISDEDGPIWFLRTHLALRVAVQFNPSQKPRSARAARAILEVLKNYAQMEGAVEIICRPGGGAVGLVEHLGFKDFNGKFLTL